MEKEIIVPKPTKEFHEAYAEIYGKKKPEGKKKEQTFVELPPLELPEASQPLVELPKGENKEQKKGFFSNLFKKREEKELHALEQLDLPPEKKQSLEIPEVSFEKQEEVPELPKGLKLKPLSLLGGKQKPLISLEDLDTPPQKQEEKKEKEKKIHDFLEEVKFGSKPTTGVFNEHKESMFEKEKLQEGARDLQSVYEKQHPHEMGGFEYLEKITPPKKPTIWEEAKPMEEESWLVEEKIPKVKKQDLKTTADIKKHLQLLKGVEKRLDQKVSELKKKQKQAQDWKARLDKQEQQVKEKLHKMTIMEYELKEKRTEVQNYEPKLAELHQQQDRLLEKERELKHRQEDVHETEEHLRKEETAIIERIRDLETDQQILEKEQDSIVKTVEKIKKERVVLNAKAKEFKEIMKRIEEAERAVKRKAELLDDRELMVKRKEEKVQKEVARVEKLKKSAEKLKDAEEAYERMKHRLREMYKEYEQRFTHQPARPEAIVKPMPLEPTFLRPGTKEVPTLLKGDITNLMTATKQLILEKHYDEANRNVNVLMSRYMQIPENNPRKKEIYYEILALKNMLKLELLE